MTARLSYVLTGEEGPDHDKTFHGAMLYVAGEKKSSGKGRTKKAAEQDSRLPLPDQLETKNRSNCMYLKSIEVQGFKSFANKIAV